MIKRCSNHSITIRVIQKGKKRQKTITKGRGKLEVILAIHVYSLLNKNKMEIYKEQQKREEKN